MRRQDIPESKRYGTKEVYLSSWKGMNTLSAAIRHVFEKYEFSPGERMIIFLSMRDSKRIKKLLKPMVGDQTDYNWCIILQKLFNGTIGRRGRFSITWSKTQQFCFMFHLKPPKEK